MALKEDLTSLINKYSVESRSDTPDFILADFLMNCLHAFEGATCERTNWYGDEKAKCSTCGFHGLPGCRIHGLGIIGEIKQCPKYTHFAGQNEKA